MSYNGNKPSESATAAEGVDIQQVLHAMIAAAGPGVVKSAFVAAGLFDPQLSGVVLDPTEPGGGYLAEQELAQGAIYIVLGVGKGVGNQEPGIAVVPIPTPTEVTS